MEQRDRTGGRGCGAECLELILGGAAQSADDRNSAAAPLSDKVAEQWEERVAPDGVGRQPADVDEYLAEPSLVGVQAGERSAPDHGRSDIDEVSVTLRTSTQNAVCKGDGVGLTPRDMRTDTRPGRQQIRRACPGGLAAQRRVQAHQCAGVVGQLVCAIPVLRMQQIDRAHVQGRRNAHAGTAVDESPREIDRHRTDVEASVDVSAFDVHQPRRSHRGCHRQHDPHRQGSAGSALTAQTARVVVGQRDMRDRGRQSAGPWLEGR